MTIAIVNMVLCLFFGISGTPGASNYLLAIFFLNLALYGSYYCTMKCLHGEKIHFVPCIYAGLGLLCFLPSLYFFTKVITYSLQTFKHSVLYGKPYMTKDIY